MSADPPGAVSMMTEVRTKVLRRVRAAGRGLRATAIAVGRVRIQLWRARLYRWRLRHVVFIGVTGSTGKTTTKDLIAAVGSTRFKGTKTEWSRNTLRWVVRTVLAVRPDDRFCVVEMSATREDGGSLPDVLKLVQPHIGVVTTVSVDHRSELGTLEQVAAEKGKLIDALPATGTAVLNADDPRVLAMRSRAAGHVITFGLAPEATVRAEDVRSAWPERLAFTVRYGGQVLPVRSQLCGTQWVTAILAALAVGVAMDVPLAEAVRAVEGVSPFMGRMSPVQHADGVTFVRDDWKASLGTIGPALQFMKDARAERKIVVMGTISDYPGNATRWYARIAHDALAVADYVIFVGPGATRGLRAQRFPGDDALRAFGTVKDAADSLERFWRRGDLVLVKGSGTADHLGRIALARTHRVECWVPRCGKRILCDSCRLLSTPGGIRRRVADSRADHSPAGDSTAVSPGAEGPVQVVVGLGNPGDAYGDTPHNVGQRVLDRLARSLEMKWEREGQAMVARADGRGARICLVKFSTSVNRTGPALAAFVRGRGVESDSVILVHDDLDLPVGVVRARMRGSAGGHRGVLSVIEAFQSSAIRRVKIGVGRPAQTAQVRDHVLTAFSPVELPVIETACGVAADRVLALIAERTQQRPAAAVGEPT